MKFSALLSALSLCTLLFCAILLLLPPSDAAVSSPKSAPKESTLFSYSMEDIDRITFDTENSDFCLVNLGTLFALKDLEELPLQESSVQALLSLLEDFPLSPCTAENTTPLRTVEISPVNASPITLELHSGGDHFFLYRNEQLYLLNAELIQPLLWSAEDYVSLSVTSPGTSDSGSLLLSGALHESPLNLSYYREESAQLYARLLSPINADIPQEQLSPILQSLSDLQADFVVCISPSQTDLEYFGLSEPFCTLTADLYGETFTLSTSALQPDGTIYLLKENHPVIFSVSLEKLPWLSACQETLCQSSLFSSQYEDCTSMTLTTPEDSWRFTKWDGQVLCGGISVEERAFHSLYQSATTLIPTQAALTSPNPDEHLLSITFSYTNPSKAQDNISFYACDEEQVFLSINGATEFLTDFSQVQTILDRCTALFS